MNNKEKFFKVFEDLNQLLSDLNIEDTIELEFCQGDQKPEARLSFKKGSNFKNIVLIERTKTKLL